MEDCMNIVIVGHIDHGKSTLIGRLLYDTKSLPEGKIEEIEKAAEKLGKNFEFAYVIDNLEEERRDEMTIDTAQIFFRSDNRKYTIIDAPGHKEFIKNMVTGASMADAAVLIVDGDKGIEDQTKRHAYLLNLLGLNKVIVVVNKMDLMGYDEEKFLDTKNDVLSFLGKIGLEPIMVIPISARIGDNVALKSSEMLWYEGPSLIEGLDSLAPSLVDDSDKLRFSVQDVYGDIIVGIVESGSISENDEILLLPDNIKANIKSIEVFEKHMKKAESGESIGITLNKGLDVSRGQILCKGPLPQISSSLNATIFCISEEGLKESDILKIKLATQEMDATLEIKERINTATLENISDRSLLENADIAKVTLSADSDLIFENFQDLPELGRFILEKNGEVVAGGVIINYPM